MNQISLPQTIIQTVHTLRTHLHLWASVGIASSISFGVVGLFTHFAVANEAGAGLAAWLFLGLALFGMIVGLSAFSRAGLGAQASSQLPFGLSFGKDETRAFWVYALIVLLAGIVIITMFTFLVALLVGVSAVAMDRLGVTEPPQTYIELWPLLNVTERVAVGVLVAGFVIFCGWFFFRLIAALPATLSAGRVQVLKVWPMTQGHTLSIALISIAISLPGLIILTLLVQLVSGLDDGALRAGMTGAIWGLGGVGLILGPLNIAHALLFRRLTELEEFNQENSQTSA